MFGLIKFFRHAQTLIDSIKKNFSARSIPANPIYSFYFASILPSFTMAAGKSIWLICCPKTLTNLHRGDPFSLLLEPSKTTKLSPCSSTELNQQIHQNITEISILHELYRVFNSNPKFSFLLWRQITKRYF